jgi:hypothetical protein
MVNDFAILNLNEEMERNAYNAAFHELGFRWHWDSDTYSELLSLSSNSAESIHHYLETRQPHLLKAYDAPFLVQVIQEKKAQHLKRRASAGTSCRHFDWAQTLGCEIGA